VAGQRTLGLADLVEDWVSTETDATWDVVWLDWDADGYLDVATAAYGAPNSIYLYRPLFGDFVLGHSLGTTEASQGLAAGDYDADGDVDLVFANGPGGVQVYDNVNGVPVAGWASPLQGVDALAVAWADVDGDGDLDLTVGYDAAIAGAPALQIYANDQNSPSTPFSLYVEDVTELRIEGLAWGGSTGGSGLALVAVSSDAEDRLYYLTGTAPSPVLNVSTVGGSLDSRSVAWGDLDGDSDLDVVVGTAGSGLLIHTVEGLSVISSEQWGAGGVLGDFLSPISVHSLDLADWDGDGDLDVLCGVEVAQHGPPGSQVAVHAFVLENLLDPVTGSGGWADSWVAPSSLESRAVAWGDAGSDSRLDVFITSNGGADRLYVGSGGLPPDVAFGATNLPASTTSEALALGDYNGDGWVDLVRGQPSGMLTLYRNDPVPGSGSRQLVEHVVSSSSVSGDTRALAWGDYDADGDLDLAVGNRGPVSPEVNHLYQNTGSGLAGLQSPIALGFEMDRTTDLAWADVDLDGDLELATAADGAPVRVYQHFASTTVFFSAWSSSNSPVAEAVAWGDMNGDGYPDLAVGGTGTASGGDLAVCVYLNVADPGGGRTLGANCAWEASGESSDQTYDLAWGDWDADGYLDLFVGNDGGPTRVYAGDGVSLGALPAWSSVESRPTRTLALEDWNGDGWVDIIEGNTDGAQDRILLGGLAGAVLLGDLDTAGLTSASTTADFDRDGDVDLVLGNSATALEFYENRRFGSAVLPNAPTTVRIEGVASPLASVVSVGSVGRYGVTPVLVGPQVEIEFSLVDADSDPVTGVELEYSLLGGGVWQPATLVGSSAGPLAASPSGTSHSLTWDLEADGVLSDMTRIRVVIPQQWPQWNAPPVQQGRVSGESATFRAYHCFPLDGDGDGFSCADDCDDDDAAVYPGAVELCDAVDSDCDDSLLDDGAFDGDGDGVPACGGADCDDTDASVYPEASEVPGDGVDQDCDGVDAHLCYEDMDGDGFGSSVAYPPANPCLAGSVDLTGDCDDSEFAIHPGASEACDLIDDDCDDDLVGPFDNLDGDVFPDCVDDDADGDGVSSPSDCDDFEATIYPGASEICDGIDQDCDESIADEEFDGDADGQTPCSGDCDDEDPSVYDGADEIPGDGVDQNCDGADAGACFEDLDGDGYGSAVVVASPLPCPTGSSEDSSDCDDASAAVNPGVSEACDGVDTDCDPATVMEPGEGDLDGDLFFACAGDCDDENPSMFPGNEEVCDGFDNDCDRTTNLVGGEADSDRDGLLFCEDCDDADASTAHVLRSCEECSSFVDLDGDGWCLLGQDVNADGDCFDAGEIAARPDPLPGECADYPILDCNEGEGAVYPGAPELCDVRGVDEDCDGSEELSLGGDPDCWPTGCDACSVSGAAGPGRAAPFWVLPLFLLLGVVRRLRTLPSLRPALNLRTVFLLVGGVVSVSFLGSVEARGVKQGALIADLIAAGQCAEAQALGSAWTEDSPGDVLAWESLGNANRCLGNTWEAVRAYRRYLALGGDSPATAKRTESLALSLSQLEVKIERDVFPERPEIEVRVGGEVIPALSESEWTSFIDLRPGVAVNVRIGGPGFELRDLVLEPLLPKEVRVTEVQLEWVGAGRIELGASSRTDLAVETLGSFRRQALVFGEPLLVTTGVHRLRVSTDDGQREVEVVVPRGGVLFFDPAPHLPASAMLARLPAGSRVRLFVAGDADRPVMREMVLPDGDEQSLVDETTGVWILPPQRVDSLVGGRGGLFVSHPMLGSGSQDIDLSPGEAASFVFDPEGLEGTAAVKEAYAGWLEADAESRRRVEGSRSAGLAVLLGGLASAGTLAALAAGLPTIGLEEASLAGKAAAAERDADVAAAGLTSAWETHRRAVDLRRALGVAAGVSAGVGVVGFSVGFGLAKNRKAVVVPPWQPWSREGSP